LQKNDHNRRIAVAALTPIFGLGAEFHGLQKDIRPADRPRRQPVVSDGTPVPAAAAGRLGERRGGDGGGASQAPRLAVGSRRRIGRTRRSDLRDLQRRGMEELVDRDLPRRKSLPMVVCEKRIERVPVRRDALLIVLAIGANALIVRLGRGRVTLCRSESPAVHAAPLPIVENA